MYMLHHTYQCVIMKYMKIGRVQQIRVVATMFDVITCFTVSTSCRKQPHQIKQLTLIADDWMAATTLDEYELFQLPSSDGDWRQAWNLTPELLNLSSLKQYSGDSSQVACYKTATQFCTCYSGKPLPVLGQLKVSVHCETQQACLPLHVVPGAKSS